MPDSNRDRTNRPSAPWRAACAIALALALACLCPLAARAQAPDPFTSARVHVGPFAVNPTLAVTGVGVDTNVFNEYENPKSDFTATVTPGADTWVRMGRARLELKLSGSYLYFARYATQRGPSTTDSARLEFDLVHIRPWAEASYSNQFTRPGYEIDARVRYLQIGYAGGADLPVSPRTTIGASYRQSRTSYGSGDSYGGYSLQSELNRTTRTATASLGYDLTPLTTFVFDAGWIRERFEYSANRDSDGYKFVPGLKFDASALVTGSAHVGYRHLRMLAPGMPEYNGVVASVDLGYVLMGITRFALQVNRDVEYSYDPAEPFYVLTGVAGSVSQAVGGPWSVTARAGAQWLVYRGQSGIGLSSPVAVPARTDVVHSYGAGIGYKLGASTRLGLNADYYTRSSDLNLLEYRGLRVGTSVTYGF